MRFLLFLLPLLVAGCASQGAAGLATVSAVAVGGALSPIGEAYHAASGDDEKVRAKIEAINTRFDPICKKKIEAILSRDPIADARLLHRAGIVALLPSMPGLTIYPGLWAPRYDISKITHGRSSAQSSKLYLELEELMNPESKDFRQPKEEHRYHSPVFTHFVDTALAYKAAFNREVYRLESDEKPNQQSSLRNTLAQPFSVYESRSSRG